MGWAGTPNPNFKTTIPESRLKKEGWSIGREKKEKIRKVCRLLLSATKTTEPNDV